MKPYKKNKKKVSATSQLLQKITFLYVICLLSIFLLAVSTDGYSNISAFKYELFLIICGGYVLISVLATLVLAATGKQPLKSPVDMWNNPSLIQKVLLIYLVLTVFSSLISSYSGTFLGARRYEGALTIMIYVFSCLFVSKYFVPKKWMLYVFGSSIFLFCALGICQLTGANPFELYPNGYNFFGAGRYYSGEYLSTIGNTGSCAALLCLSAGIFSMALICMNFRRKWLLAISLFMAVFTIFEINIEAGMVGLIAGLLLMLPVAITNKERVQNTLAVFSIMLGAFALSKLLVFSNNYVELKMTAQLVAVAAVIVLTCIAVFVLKHSRLFYNVQTMAFRKAAWGVVAVVVIIIIVFLWFYDGEKTGFVYEASELIHGRWSDDFGSSRVYIWRNVFEGIKTNVLLGTGPDTIGQWSIEPFRMYSEAIGTEIVANVDVAHNEYLNIAACQGILALFAYLGALIWAAIRWYRHPENHVLAIAGAGVLYYCIQAFFGISICITSPFFWTAFAVLIYGAVTNPKSLRC